MEPVSWHASALLAILILLAVGLWPGWPHAADWGFTPVILIVTLGVGVLILAAMGKI